MKLLSRTNLSIVSILIILFHFKSLASKTDVPLYSDFWKEAKITKHEVKLGQNLSTILQSAGFTSENVHRLVQAEVIPRKYKIMSGDLYLKWQKGRLRGIKLFDHYFKNAYVFIKDDTSVVGRAVDIQYNKRTVQKKGRVFGSLIESIKKQTQNEALAYRFLDAYELEINPAKKLKRGDRFALEFERLYVGDTFIRFGEVLRTELEVNGKSLERKFVAFDDGGGVFVSNNFGEDVHRVFYAPVSYISISSPFNPRRFHPIKKRRQPHLGVDFELPPGSPVFASRQGVVTRVSKSRAGGHYVIIDHKDGYKSFYNHMSAVTKGLKAGDELPAGAVVGQIGCTGYCTKPHLHFAIKRGNRFIDPAKIIKGYPYHYEKDLMQKTIVGAASSKEMADNRD